MAFARLYLDEDLYRGVAEGLRRRGFDVLTTIEAGRSGTGDEEQLRFAVEEGRAVVTFNRGHFAQLHADYLAGGRRHYGIIVSAQAHILPPDLSSGVEVRCPFQAHPMHHYACKLLICRLFKGSPPDRDHLNERLGEVLRVMEPDAATRAARLSQWNESLDRTDSAIYRIRAQIRTAYADACARQDTTVRDQLDPHVTYLDNNASLMRYARLRDVGLPVGSGVTEAACKSVIVQRTNGRSQRWHPEGLDAVLTLRFLHVSDRLPRFWAHLARTYRKEIRLCA